jgi:uncharacterized protein (TIGR03083 family)
MMIDGNPVRAAKLPQTSRADAPAVARPQYDAFLAQLRDLHEADWSRPTDCAEWTVRDIAAHVTGAADEGAHLRVMLRHLRHAKRGARASLVDGLNDAQIADRQDVSTDRLLGDLERLSGKAIRARRRAPGPMRGRAVPGDDLPAGSNFAYLFDVIFARDVWMHRVDVARATGRPLDPAASDAAVVAQVMRDLDRFWAGPPVELQLTGPAGGTWLLGAGTSQARVAVDGIEYLRLLSGRPGEPQVAVDGNPDVRACVLSARVAF